MRFLEIIIALIQGICEVDCIHEREHHGLALLGMEVGWETRDFNKQWMGSPRATLMLSRPSMFVFMPCKRKKDIAQCCVTADLTVFLGSFSSPLLLLWVETVLG